MKPVPFNPSHPLVKHLWPISALTHPNERVAATIKAYTEATGIHPSHPLTEADRRQIRDWLICEQKNAPTNEDGHSVALLSGERTPIGIPRIHEDLPWKAGWLQQAPCITCIHATNVTPLSISLPIRTRPFSAQSMDASKLTSLKQKIMQYLSSRNHDLSAWASYELCVAVVAVVPRSEQRKDVDNMVKGLLDAMQGSIYTDDRMVQHLCVRRLARDGDHSLAYYMTHITPVEDARNDVIDQTMRIEWSGQQEIVADV
ncbi:MAG: RusA family crossover junction endodeoxyribonuclease [Actinomycetota bacterium]|nr:RusA family crossover junction endodeoxyribonuclease [Actinomycetota bacterium]